MTLQVLPPVPPVNVTLQPHHQTQPVGVILSVRSHHPITKDQLMETSNAHTVVHMHTVVPNTTCFIFQICFPVQHARSFVLTSVTVQVREGDLLITFT